MSHMQKMTVHLQAVLQQSQAKPLGISFPPQARQIITLYIGVRAHQGLGPPSVLRQYQRALRIDIPPTRSHGTA